MNTGKYDLMYVTALPMNNSVYEGMRSKPVNVAAKIAMIGAIMITENPRYANVIKPIKLSKITRILKSMCTLNSFKHCDK